MFGGIFKKNVGAVQTMSKVVNTLAKPVTEAVASVQKKVESSSDEEDEIDETPEVARTVDITIEPGGGKGWPSDVATVFYHKLQGLICVGTDSGVVYSYGDGFQFMRPLTREEGTRVCNIVALDPDYILVTFSDNSVDVLELPSLNLIGDLPSSWVGAKNGNITAVYVDEPGEKNFTYVGTSEGVLQVLEVTDLHVRVCDFVLTWKTMGLGRQMSITDIALCPKEEKYLAVSFESSMVHQGAVVIYDLSKMKVHRVFETKSVSTLAWNNTGDTLFGGTKDGMLLSFGLDRPNFQSPWNATTERVDEDDLDEVGEEPVSIRKLVWMAPQPPSVDGCLFALLGCPGGDNDSLKSVVVGLSPVGSHGELETVFSLPAIPAEKVINFSLVPTYLKSDAALAMLNTHVGEEDEGEEGGEESAEQREDALRATITPAVLLLTERHGDEDAGEEPEETARNLKIVRCPAVDMATWALEVGDIAEPRLANEVLPGNSTVTCISGLVPEKSVLSLSAVLIAKSTESEGVIAAAPRANASPAPSTGAAQVANQRNKALRRLSTRDFFDLKSLDQQIQAVDAWEMVLAVGEHSDANRTKVGKRIQDVIFKGYENGTVVAWGVSLPESRGNIWLPLMSMRCGKSAVTCISHDEHAGLLLAADSSGVLVIWEIYEEGSGMSASEILRRENQQATVLAKGRAEEKAAAARQKARQTNSSARNIYPDDDDKDDSSDEENEERDSFTEGPDYAMYCSYAFNNCREVLRTRLHNPITATLLISQFTTVIVGTEDGTVYACTQFTTVLFSEIEHVDRHGTSGAVVGLTFGNFMIEEKHVVAAVYVAFASGHVGVVQLNTLQMIAYGPKLNATHSALTSESSKHFTNVEMCLADGHHSKMPTPTLREVALNMAEDAVLSGPAGMEVGSSTHGSSAHGSSDGSTPRGGDFGAKFKQGFDDFGGKIMTLKTQMDTSAQATARAINNSALATAQALKLPTNPNHVYMNTPASQAMLRAKIPFSRIPRYLIMLVGKLFITFDLLKFTRVATKTSLAGKHSGAVSVKVISQKNMVVSNFLWYRTPIDADVSDDEDGGDAMLVAAAVNAQGLMVMVSAKERGLINHSQLVEETSTGDKTLQFGCILPNGNCYLVRTGGEMVYTSTITLTNTTMTLPHPLPERISPGATAPKSGLLLLHGREAMIASKRAALRKRRQSVLKISSSPFDIAKVFSKSRAERQKDELIAKEEHEDSSGKGDASHTKSATNKATKAMAGLNDTKEALQERGVKINRAAIKADEVQQGASDFSKAAKEQKEQLKSKNKRWGLF